jgi:hypothetical protein
MLLPYYALRLMRIRMNKNALLHSLNYLASVRRRLLYDLYGCGFCAPPKSDGAITNVQQKQFKPAPSAETIARGGALVELTLHESPMDMALASSALAELDAVEQSVETAEPHGDELRIRDANGVRIMHELAVQELQALDTEIARIITIFIGEEHKTNQKADRLAMLDDAYEAEALLAQRKVALISVYLEVYTHAIDAAEQRTLRRRILEISTRRPLLDLKAAYFTEAYVSASMRLQLEHDLTQHVLHAQLHAEREYRNSILERHGQSRIWPPPRIGSFPPYAVHKAAPLPQLAQGCMYSVAEGHDAIGVIDIYASLGCIGAIADALDRAVSEIAAVNDVRGGVLLTDTHQCVLQQVMVDWRLMVEEESMWRSMSADTSEVAAVGQHVLADDPFAWEAAAELVGLKLREASARRAGEDVGVRALLLCIDAVCARESLLAAVWQTEILRAIHSQQAMVCGVELPGRDDPLNFEGGMAMTAPRLRMETVEISTTMVDAISRLAVQEIERELVVVDFSSIESLADVAHAAPASGLRLALLVQSMELAVFSVCSQYSQMILDRPLMALHAKEKRLSGNVLSILSQSFFAKPAAGLQTTGDVMTEKMEKLASQLRAFHAANINPIRSLFLSASRVKALGRRQLVDKYLSQVHSVPKAAGAEARSALKCALVKQFALTVGEELRAYAIKAEIGALMCRLERAARTLPAEANLFFQAADAQLTDALPQLPLLQPPELTEARADGASGLAPC